MGKLKPCTWKGSGKGWEIDMNKCSESANVRHHKNTSKINILLSGIIFIKNFLLLFIPVFI